MRIAILTLPLHTNYGGILQAYALQTVLERMGHTVMVIFCRNIPRYYIYLSNLKTAVLRVLGNRNRKWKTYGKDKDAPVTYNFFREKINLTQPVYNVKSFLINKYRIDGIVVGSDQVWRPPYVRNIYTYYLNFAKKYPVKKIAYATSFGTSEWEYTKKEELKCSSLIPKFDKVTVREKEGITLCKEHFGIDASLVLDPTLLLEIEDYNELCKSVPSKQPFIGCYILDNSHEIENFISELSKEYDLPVIEMNKKESLTPVEEWISYFRDAQYIITDSFHGSVFSIIYNKPFFNLGNNARGMSRITNVLNLFNLKECLIDISEISTIGKQTKKFPNINWNVVNQIKRGLAEKSKFILNSSLS